MYVEKNSMLPWKSKGSIYEENVQTNSRTVFQQKHGMVMINFINKSVIRNTTTSFFTIVVFNLWLTIGKKDSLACNKPPNWYSTI